MTSLNRALACATDQTARFSDIFASAIYDHSDHYSHKSPRVKLSGFEQAFACPVRFGGRQPSFYYFGLLLWRAEGDALPLHLVDDGFRALVALGGELSGPAG